MGDQLSLELLAADELTDFLAREGYRNLRFCGAAGLCGTRALLFSTGLFTDLSLSGHGGRYCYESTAEAVRALEAWDGTGDPAGPWIKFKSARTERLGPGCGLNP